jgi:DNA-binding MarR family transcriptional regulator
MTTQTDTRVGVQYEARGMAEWLALYEAYNAIFKLAEFVLLPHNLSLPQLTVLSILKRGGGVVTTDEVDRAVVKAGHATGLVDRLEARGLVERQFGWRDGRKTWVRLTEDGESKLQEVMPVASRLAEEISRILTDQRLRDLREGLGTLTAAATGRLNEALGRSPAEPASAGGLQTASKSPCQ